MSHPGTRTAEAGQGELLLVEQLWDVLINEIPVVCQRIKGMPFKEEKLRGCLHGTKNTE